MRKKVHFIGIAGMGMSAAAILLKSQGWEVSGSDSESYPPGTTQLEKHGIPFNTSYDASHVPDGADVIVVGINAKLRREENPEVEAAHTSGARIASFPELLGEITAKRETLVVAGSYGKSTVTSLIAWCLSHAGGDAGWFVGAAPEEMEPAYLGTHPVFVLEGDEYPTSHTDARPKFSHYHAHDCIITAASHDHVNIYKTQEEFLRPFRALAASLPDDGLLVLCADEPHAFSLGKDTRARVVSYGLSSSAEWHANNILHGEKTTFDLMRDGKKVARIETALLGDHNVQNIVGAAAMLLEKELVTPQQLAAAVADFKGLARRLDKKTSRSSVPAYEGFGSSREKLHAAIRALKAQYPEKRLIVVFEPHTFSWRNKKMLHWFDTAFEGAGLVILYKPADQGAATHEQSSQQEMRDRLARSGVRVVSVVDANETMDALQKEVTRDDVILLSSSGGMDGLIERIPEWLDNTFT